MSSRSSSFGDNSCSRCGREKNEKELEMALPMKPQGGSTTDHHVVQVPQSEKR